MGIVGRVKEAATETVEGAKEVGGELAEGDLQGAVQEAQETVEEVKEHEGQNKKKDKDKKGGGQKKDTGGTDSKGTDSKDTGGPTSISSGDGGDGAGKDKTNIEKVENALTGMNKSEKKEAAKDFVKNQGLNNLSEEEVENKIKNRYPLQPPQQKRNQEALVSNVKTQEKARDKKQEVDQQIEKIKSGPTRQEQLRQLKDRKQDVLDKSEETGKVYNITELNQAIDRLEAGQGLYTIEKDGETERVSQDEAIDRLEENKQQLTQAEQTAEENIGRLVSSPEQNSIEIPASVERDLQQQNQDKDFNQGLTYERYPGARQEIAEKQNKLANTALGPDKREELQSEIQNLKTKVNQPAEIIGGTDIPGQSYLDKSKTGFIQEVETEKQGGPDLENAELEDFSTPARFVRSVEVLGTTSAGFTQFGAAVDPDRTVSDIVEDKSQEMASTDSSVNRGLELLGSPLGVVGTAGIGAVAKTTSLGVSATVGGGRISQAAGTAAKTAGAGLVGYETGRGAKNIQQGNISRGVGQIVRVGAEVGAFSKGFRKASDKYGPELAPTTKVDQDNFLRQIKNADDESLLIGSGKFTAQTNIVQRVPLTKNRPQNYRVVDEVTSKGEYRIVADEKGAEAQGTINDQLLNDQTQERNFESVSTVIARSGDQEKVATRNILRTRKDGKLFRQFKDESRFSVTKKEGEKPINEIRGYNYQQINQPVEVEDALGRKNVVGQLKRDVVTQIRRGNVDAKTVELSSFSKKDGASIFTETNNLIINARRGGAGPSTGSGRQGLQFRNEYGDGEITELGRQTQTGEKLGERSREIAEQELEKGTGIAAYSIPGGGSGQGRQAEAQAGGQIQTPQGTGELEAPDLGGRQDLTVSRTQTGQQVLNEVDVSVIGRSGQPSTGNRDGLQQRRRTREDITASTGPRTGINERNAIGLDERLGEKSGLRQRSGTRNLNQLRQVEKTGLTQTPRAGLRAISAPKITGKTQLGLKSTSNLTTTTTTVPAVPGIGGGLLLPLDLDVGERGRGTQGEGNLRTPGRIKSDVNISILSANRAELLTGSKTFRLSSDEVTEYSQTAFSGGLQTVEEQNLEERTYGFNSNQGDYF